MVMQFFRSERDNLLKKIERGEWQDPQNKLQLLAKAAGSGDYRLSDLAFMFRHADMEVVRYATEHALPQATTSEILTTLLGVLPKLATQPQQRSVVLESLRKVRPEPLARQISQRLHSGDALQVEAALGLLEQLPPLPDWLPCWNDALEKLQGPLRQRALDSLFAGEMWRDQSLLEGLARDPDPHVRLRFLDALRSHGVSPFEGVVALALQDDAPQVRHAALELLSAAQPVLRPADLLPLSTLADTRVRDSAVRNLLTPESKRPQHLRQLLARLAEVSERDAERGLRSLAALAIDLYPLLGEVYGEAQGAVRRLAGRALLGGDDAHTRTAALELVSGEDWWTRVAALDALARLKDEEVVPKLVPLLRDEQIRAPTIGALVAIGGEGASELVNNLLEDPRPEVRREVLQAIDRHCAAEAGDLLQHMAQNDPETSNQQYAQAILGNLAPGEADFNDPLPGPPHPRLEELCQRAADALATDLHLAADSEPRFRVDGALSGVGDKLSASEFNTLVDSMLSPPQRQALPSAQTMEVGFRRRSGTWVRGQIFTSQRGRQARLHIFPAHPPPLAELGLPACVTQSTQLTHGLVVLAGPSGSGRATTRAALVEAIAAQRSVSIVCLEATTELELTAGCGLIHQRRRGVHFQSWAEGIWQALDSDADLIVAAELDAEGLWWALEACHAGKLIVLSPRATSISGALSSLAANLPAPRRAQGLRRLAEQLQLALCQVLIAGKGGGRIACCSWIQPWDALRARMATGAFDELAELIGARPECMTRDRALAAMLEAGRIELEEAQLWAEHPADLPESRRTEASA